MKTEELVLIGAAVAGAYFLFKEPKKKTVGEQVGDFINTVFAPGQANPISNDLRTYSVGGGMMGDPNYYSRNLISADVIPPTAGLVGMVPTPRSTVSSALMLPDNGAVTYVDYSGATPIGMPVVTPSWANDTLASPIMAESIGIPSTAIQSPEAWQNGGAQYIGDNPPFQVNPPALAVVGVPINDPEGNQIGGLVRVNPDYQLAPFEWFRTDESGRRFVVSALSGQDIKFLEWASD